MNSNVNYILVNMGTFGDKSQPYYCLDICITSKNTNIKRIFIQKKTYDKLVSLFKDNIDMYIFDINKYIYLEPNFKGEFQLRIFEELIQAI